MGASGAASVELDAKVPKQQKRRNGPQASIRTLSENACAVTQSADAALRWPSVAAYSFNRRSFASAM